MAKTISKKGVTEAKKEAPKKKAKNLQWYNPNTECLCFNDRTEIYPFDPIKDIDEYRRQFIPDYIKEGFETYNLVDSYAEQLSYVIKNRLNGFIVGPTGCGKSSGIRYSCSLLEYPVRTFEFSRESTISGLIGTRTVKQSDKGSYVVWLNGIALDCWEKGMGLILEEVDSAPPGLLFALHSLLQVKSMYFEVPEKSDKLIKRHPDFWVMATANTIGKGEDSFLYTGTNILNEAFLDRFSINYRLDYLSEADEAQVLVEEFAKADMKLPKSFANAYAKCATLLRLDQGLKTTTFSTRRLVEWANMTQQIDWRKPVEFSNYTVLNKMTEQNRLVAEKVIKSVWGDDRKRMDEHDVTTDPSSIKAFEKVL